MKNLAVLKTVALLPLLALAGCHREVAAPSGSPVLAKAGGEVITVDDFDREVQRRLAKHVPVPDKNALIEEMLGRLAAVTRAKQAKLDGDAETKREMENVLIAKLRAQELEAKLNAATVTDAELKAAFAAGAAAYSHPAKVRMAILHLQGDMKMSDAKRSELRSRMEEALKKAAEAPAPGGRGGAATGFGQIAAEYSDDQVTRYRGGDLGWLDEGNYSYRWPKPVLEAGFALPQGGVSGIIEADNGLYAIMKTDHRDGGSTTLEEAAPSLRHDLLVKKRAEIEAAFLKENRSLTNAEIRQDVLATVTLPAAASPAQVTASAPPTLPGMKPAAPPSR
ncbi:MAG TPA: peptidylprolyl isomerase [Verrucomicrobiales bacterium]|nr:peptidylprolyl isomerase [Verrucomicrobiales bacterium]